MKVSIVGVGMGNINTLTGEALMAIQNAQCLIGAKRLLDAAPQEKTEQKRAVAIQPEEIIKVLCECNCEHAAVLMSGDVGFYSGAKRLRAGLMQLKKGEFVVESIAGISSLQYFCARIGESWDDAHLVSLHGCGSSVAGHVMGHGKTFFLTGGENSVQAICQTLCENGLADTQISVGEKLSYPDECVTYGTAKQLAQREFTPLAVLLVQNPNPNAPALTHGLQDEAFLRGDAPMTKREVRTVAISAMNLRAGQTVWDVGAGTGSVSIELARLLPDGIVYAVEHDAPALELLEQNKIHFGVGNLRIVKGSAPTALKKLPVPDTVFIGGTSGEMSAVFSCILHKNPQARIVATAIMLETVSAVLACFDHHALKNVEVVQLSVARARVLGGGHMMMGQNPVYILSGGGVRDDS